MDKWKQYSQEEALINSLVNNFSDFDIKNAKLDELNKWKTHTVYDAVDNCNEKFIDLRWDFSEKYINGELNVEAWPAKGFQEDNSDILSNSPTCSKESMRLVLNIITSSKWLWWSIDIKSAFLQNKNIDRVVYVKPPKDCQDTTLWKLNTTIYGLYEASRSWYFNVKKELIGLVAIVCKSDLAVFVRHNQSKVNGLLCTNVDDFLFKRTELFLTKLINPIKRVFTNGSEHCAAFKYFGLNISQPISEIIIDQVNYVKSVDLLLYQAIEKTRKMTYCVKKKLII